jgi:hypothetical protein
VGQVLADNEVAVAPVEDDPVGAGLVLVAEEVDDVGPGHLLVDVPPDRGALVGVGDLVVVADRDLEVAAVPAELGLELAGARRAGVGEVGLGGEEEVAAAEALGAVLGDGDLQVGVEVGGELVGPGGDVVAESDGHVSLHHGPEEEEARERRTQACPLVHHRHGCLLVNYSLELILSTCTLFDLKCRSMPVYIDHHSHGSSWEMHAAS